MPGKRWGYDQKDFDLMFLGVRNLQRILCEFLMMCFCNSNL